MRVESFYSILPGEIFDASTTICSEAMIRLVYVCGEKIYQRNGQWKEKDGVVKY